MLIQPLDIFKKSWQIFKANYLVFWQIVAWLLAPAVLLGLLGLLDQKLGSAFLNYSVPIYLALSALAFIIGLWVNIVLARLIFNALRQTSVDKKILTREAWRDTVSYLWISILVGLIALVGLILLVIPGLIFAVWYSFALLIFVLEGTKGYEALKKSKALVSGRFWLVVWRWIVPYFIYSVILVVIVGAPALLVGYLTKFVGFGLTAGGTLSYPWWFSLWQSVVAVLTMPLTIGFGVVLYDNLKRKDS